MKVKVLKTESEYNIAMARLEEIFAAKKNTPEGNELEVLAVLIDKYEKEKFAIECPDPIEIIKFRMEQLGLKQKDLVDAVGYKSRVSDILSGRRKLTVDMIRSLSETLHVSPEFLIGGR